MRTLAALFLIASAARAETGSVSLRGGVAALSGQSGHGAVGALAGAQGLWRFDEWLVGAGLDVTSEVNGTSSGDVSHLFVGAIGGQSIDLSDGLRIDLLGELGAHRLSGARSGPFHVPSSNAPDPTLEDVYLQTDPAWAAYLGVRPSLEWSMEPYAFGAGLWVRADLSALTPKPYLTPTPSFTAQGVNESLGRFSAGLDLHVSYRF